MSWTKWTEGPAAATRPQPDRELEHAGDLLLKLYIRLRGSRIPGFRVSRARLLEWRPKFGQLAARLRRHSLDGREYLACMCRELPVPYVNLITSEPMVAQFPEMCALEARVSASDEVQALECCIGFEGKERAVHHGEDRASPLVRYLMALRWQLESAELLHQAASEEWLLAAAERRADVSRAFPELDLGGLFGDGDLD